MGNKGAIPDETIIFVLLVKKGIQQYVEVIDGMRGQKLRMNLDIAKILDQEVLLETELFIFLQRDLKLSHWKVMIYDN